MPNFNNMPPEVRFMIVSFVVDYWRTDEETAPITPYSTVCSEWKDIVERYTFASLVVTSERVEDFKKFIVGRRRRFVRHIDLQVLLPAYPNDPCELRENWADMRENNIAFTTAFRSLFDVMHEWKPEECAPSGISLIFSIFSESDLRKSSFELWQRRRWNVSDIGEKRFIDSFIDFDGMDDESTRVLVLQPVKVISSFAVDTLNRRAVLPLAYGDIVASLPCAKSISLDIIKDRKRDSQRTNLTEFAGLFPRWPTTVETLNLSGNTLVSWRQLPHDDISETEKDKELCESLRKFAPQLRHLSLRNFVRIKEFFAPVWVKSFADQDAFTTKAPDMPTFWRLETLDVQYGALSYKIDWHKDTDDLSSHDDTEQFRQCISLSAARMALHMPAVTHMCIAQRPLMWAGRHEIRYTVKDGRAHINWLSTFPFEPWLRTQEAWEAVAMARTGRPPIFSFQLKNDWSTDGPLPVMPAVSI